MRLTKAEREANIFRAFLKSNPNFAGEAIASWNQPVSDPPDILCTTVSGRKIGIELRAWLDESEMKDGKIHERYETAIREALEPQGDNNFKAVHFVWLTPTVAVLKGIPVGERGQFRAEVLAKIAEIDEALDASGNPQGEGSNDFSAYPMLQKYILDVHCHPRKIWRPNGNYGMRTWPKGMDWIMLRDRGGAYTHETMRDALILALDEKREHYATKPGGMDEFHLLIHYDAALYYNSPISTPFFNVNDAFHIAKQHVNGAPGPFERIFVFLAIEPGETTFQVY